MERFSKTMAMTAQHKRKGREHGEERWEEQNTLRKQRRIRGKKRNKKERDWCTIKHDPKKKNQIQILCVCGCLFFPLSFLFFSLSMLVCTEAVRRLIGCQPAKDHQQLGRKERDIRNCRQVEAAGACNWRWGFGDWGKMKGLNKSTGITRYSAG